MPSHGGDTRAPNNCGWLLAESTGSTLGIGMLEGPREPSRLYQEAMEYRVRYSQLLRGLDQRLRSALNRERCEE
jgi:hypothetical protein